MVFFIAFRADQIVSGDVGVAGVEADAHRRRDLEPLDQLGDLLKAATQ